MAPASNACQSASALPDVARCLRAQVRAAPSRIALQEGRRSLSYAQLDERTSRLAQALIARGVTQGERLAVLSENRAEYLELKLAAAKAGAIVACQNWRQAADELAYCLDLVQPRILFTSPRFAAAAVAAAPDVESVEFGDAYEQLLAAAPPGDPRVEIDAEQGLTLLYTSGTTGRPKGALISHRAIVARSLANALDHPAEDDDAFVAWSPLFHMGASDHALAAFMRGAKVIVMDGFDGAALAQVVATERLGWLHVMPGTADRLAAALTAARARPQGIRCIGVMADLMPRHRIAELTTLLAAPYVNTFGSTEAGGILSKGTIPVGQVPQRLGKRASSLCEIRLVDENDADVADGTPGELVVRSPCLFSGYWADPQRTAQAFEGGWFRTGDVFARQPDGSLDFVDRRKYLIKSGGENIYPAEIERVLLASEAVAEAVVVRRPDPQWGEVPVVFVVAREAGLGPQQVLSLCDGKLARYKRPREVHFVAAADIPRSASGKAVRGELELRLLRMIAGETAWK